MPDDTDPERSLRAARMAGLPGVKRAEAAERFGLSVPALRRAMAAHVADSYPSRRDLVLHLLTDAGRRRTGPAPDLATVAGYLDYVNKDGSTAADVSALLDALQADGVLAVEREGWRLLVEFP